MKTAIITFTNELNYGAVLQAYALQNFLEKKVETEIINFKFDLNSTSFLRKSLEIIKKIKFDFFKRKYLKMSSKRINNFNDFKRNMQNYTVAIVGSDQVWALDIIKNWKDIFFLNNIKNVRKYSYAASFGKNENYIENKDEIGKYLNDFESISIREKSSCDLLKMDNIENYFCVDPTLLLNSEDYINSLNLTKYNKKYILVYMLVIDEKLVDIANKVSEIMGLKIYCFNNKNRFGKNGICIPNSSPRKFVEMFYNAEFVITNSFHGTCFSIIFNKRFISVIHPSRGIRQKDMLLNLGLSDRIYSDKVELNYYIDNDICKSDLFINEIKNSKEYLNLIINGDINERKKTGN